jgi:hypothetical protein
MPSIVLFLSPEIRRTGDRHGVKDEQDADHGLPGVQGRLDGRPIAQAEGLISLPDPPD